MVKINIKDLLIEELENKKSYFANRPFGCQLCGSTVEEGDEFVFFGNKKKICTNCLGEIIESVGGL